MSDTFVISGLKAKRSAMAGRIVDLRYEAEKLQADLVHLDAVLRLYNIEPDEIPTKGRMPVRSAYFGRYEISRRCRAMLREKDTIRAVDVAAQAMRDKHMDPATDLKTRRDFTRRILITLHDLRKAGHIEKVGHGKGVLWRATAALPQRNAGASSGGTCNVAEAISGFWRLLATAQDASMRFRISCGDSTVPDF